MPKNHQFQFQPPKTTIETKPNTSNPLPSDTGNTQCFIIETKAILREELPRHKSLRSTEIYINIQHTIFDVSSDESTVMVAINPEEIKSLLEVGFDYVCRKDGLMFLRKRK